MRREPDDVRGGALDPSAPTPPGGTRPIGEMGPDLAARLPVEERDTFRRGDLFPKEADTLTSHDALPPVPRRDTMPVPPMMDPPANDEDEDELLDEELLEDADDDTQTQAEPRFHPSGDEPTSPTLSLANQSDSAREVYRMFLASDYAPALQLANELIAQGMDDPMLVTIARECRSSLAALDSSVPPPPVLNDGAPRPRVPLFAALEPRSVLGPPSPPLRGPRGAFAAFDGTTTIGEVASMTGLSVEQVLGLLERFVGALPARPQR